MLTVDDCEGTDKNYGMVHKLWWCRFLFEYSLSDIWLVSSFYLKKSNVWEMVSETLRKINKSPKDMKRLRFDYLFPFFAANQHCGHVRRGCGVCESSSTPDPGLYIYQHQFSIWNEGKWLEKNLSERAIEQWLVTQTIKINHFVFLFVFIIFSVLFYWFRSWQSNRRGADAHLKKNNKVSFRIDIYIYIYM